jgi:hypothetical protein
VRDLALLVVLVPEALVALLVVDPTLHAAARAAVTVTTIVETIADHVRPCREQVLVRAVVPLALEVLLMVVLSTDLSRSVLLQRSR